MIDAIALCVVMAFLVAQTYLNVVTSRRIRELRGRVSALSATTDKVVAVVGGGDDKALLIGRAVEVESPTARVERFGRLAVLQQTMRRASRFTRYDVFIAGFPIWEDFELSELQELFKLLPKTRQDDALRAYYNRQDHKREERALGQL